MNQARSRLVVAVYSTALLAFVSSGCVDVHVAPSCFTAADAAAPSDQGVAHADGGVPSARDAEVIDGATPDGATPHETKEDAANPSAPDSAFGFDASGAHDSQGDAGLLFEGAPACETFGFKLLGVIAAMPVDEHAADGWASSGETHTITTSYGNESDGGAVINMRLTWSHDLVAGEVTPIVNGTLRNVVADPSATYCVTAGSVGMLPLQPAQAVSYQLRVTGVQASLNGECTGPILTADLRGCLRAAVIF